jgi:decaprenylphospho-beta-D-erythro-pentofuranosid-2-ulose 2-reductase
MKLKTAIIIGASSGIGREVAIQLAQQGVRVAVVARRKERLHELELQFPSLVQAYEHDVCNTAEISALFVEITKNLGGLDLFVYSSGVMPEVEPTEFSLDKDASMIEVNVLGAVAWCNTAAQRFMNTKHGSIIGIGSVAGDRGRHGYPVYNASKAFFHTYLEALRNRVSRYGVKVVTIKPGPVDTEMTQHLSISKMSASVAAAVILKRADKNGEFYLKFAHRVAFYIIKRIPSPIFRKLKI